MTLPSVSKDPLVRFAEQQTWTSDEGERSLQAVIKQVVHSVGGDKLRRALHGDWLNEPMHAVLTDIPIGSWSATVVCDAFAAAVGPSEFATTMDHAADATLLIGLVGALAASVTGIHDWSEIEQPQARKVGLAHAAANIAATSLFVGSAIFRARKNEEKPGEATQDRAIGRVLGMAGYLLLSAGAHLGGSLTYDRGIGVKTGDREESVTESMKG